MAIYTVAIGKGGAGKSTTAAELVAHLTRAGRTVRALDTDRQGNFSTRLGLGADTEGVEVVAADVLAGQGSPAQAMASPSVPGAWVLPGTLDLDELDDPMDSMVERIRRAAAGVDDLVIDTRPSLHPVTEAALRAADTIVVPCPGEGEAFDQVEELAAFLQLRVGGDQSIGAVVPTCHDARRVLDREVLELLQEKWPDHVTAPIRERVAVKESYVAGQPFSLYAPTSETAADYAAVCAVITGIPAATTERTPS